MGYEFKEDLNSNRIEIEIRKLIGEQIALKRQADIDVAYEKLAIDREEGNIALLSHKSEVTDNQEDYRQFSEETEWAIENINQAELNIDVIKNNYAYDRDNLKLDIIELTKGYYENE